MASFSDQHLVAILRSDTIKHHLLPLLSPTDLASLRAVSPSTCNLLTKPLFTRITLTFTPSTFTKPARLAALARIGHHVEHLTFHFPHSDATFLPPLVHPSTGREIQFLYKPHTSMGDVLARRKYANTELGEILTAQYPPLFHAATNVPSFIHAMGMVRRLRHVTIKTPGQDPKERYRRDIVDYALISLRIALERAELPALEKLSLSSLHPSAFTYLRHTNGFGTVPSAGKRWAQIKKLHISVEAWDFYSPSSPGLDHLKVIDDYIRNFSPRLEKFAFTWLNRKGPCPIALSEDVSLFPAAGRSSGGSTSSRKLFNEVTSPMSPLPTLPARTRMHFPKLRYMQIRNATMTAPQLKELINSHAKTVKEFDFENVALVNNGSWDEALGTLDQDHAWSRSSSSSSSSLAPSSSECSFVSEESFEDDLPTPSAAVEAAGRELGVDLGGYGFSEEDRDIIEGMGMGEEVMSAKEEGVGVTTKIKKRRRRRRRHHSEDSSSSSSSNRPSYNEAPRTPVTPPPPSSSSSTSSLRRKLSRSHSRPSIDSSLGPITPPPAPLHPALISPPILSPTPHPVLLQPAVYDPSAKHLSSGISSVQRNIEQEQAHLLMAEDVAARTSALQKAKEAVLAKLRGEAQGGTTTDASRRRPRLRRHGTSGSGNAVAACRMMTGSRDFLGGCGSEYVVEDRRGLQTGSVVVPLMFSRA